MGRPLLTRRTVLAAKIESVAYAAEILGNADSNFNIYDVVATPNIELKKREAADGFSNRASTTGLRSGTVTFKADVHGDGAGGVPLWASTFLPACAIVDNGSGTFGPVTATPFEAGADPITDRGVRTVTIAVYEDGRRKRITGAMGNAKWMYPTGKDAYIEFSFQGSWSDVIDEMIPVPAYPPQLPLRFADATLEIDGFVPCVGEASVDFGNSVQLRECQLNPNASGYRGAFIGDRKVVGSLDPEAQLVADRDRFGDWINSREQPMVIEVRDGVDRITTNIPKFQITNIGEGDKNGLRTDPYQYQANRDVAGDDEIRITFAAA